MQFVGVKDSDPKRLVSKEEIVLPADTFLTEFYYGSTFVSAGGTGTENGLITTTTGTSASCSPTPSTSALGNRVGIMQATTGTTATGMAGLISYTSLTTFGNAEWTYAAEGQVPTLSDATERFALSIGFWDQTGQITHFDGAYFLYDEGGVHTGNTASGNWKVVTVANQSRTISDTGVAVAAGTWTRFRVVVNSAGTQAQFFIDGTLVATHTTNIPTGNNVFGFGFQIYKSVGTTARTFLVDWVRVRGIYNTALLA